MWRAQAGWWSGALAAVALLLALLLLALLLLLLAARCRRRRKLPRDTPPHAVHIVRDALPLHPRRAALAPPPAPPTAPPTLPTAAARAPPPPAPPQRAALASQPPPSPPAGDPPSAPRLPPPSQWLHKRPPACKYTATIPRPLAQIVTALGADLCQESRAQKYGATRSPSLEKDDKSPLGASGMSAGPPLRGRGSPDRAEDEPTFDFSPRILADAVGSPRFFTPPETVSPMFFAEPSPRSVYYDSVRSPKFFAEAPREAEPAMPQSPRALADHLNRNGVEKPSSPRVGSAKPSPKVHSCNKENYFTFEQARSEEGARVSPRPRRYGGRNSIERERFTPPGDREAKKYRRHNSCDTNYRPVEVDVTQCEDNKVADATDRDVVDCCAKLDRIQIDAEDRSDELLASPSNSASARRRRLQSISLDSDNAKIIEQNLGLPIAKQMKDQMNEAYKNQEVSASCESVERSVKSPSSERPKFKFDDEPKASQEQPTSPDLKQRKSLRQSCDTQSFLDMPRFSPKEFEITVTSEEGTTVPAEAQTKRKGKNLRNLTIDLTKRDSDLEKELLEFEKLYTNAEEKKVKTPTLKVKATSLDSSESVNLSLPQKKTLEIPQNSVSVPNTPKRQLKRILAQKSMKHDFGGAKGHCSQANPERRLYMKGQDSGIYLRENHASLMLYQPGTSRVGSRTMGSFDENTADLADPAEASGCGVGRPCHLEPAQGLGSNLLNYKQGLSVSSTNLKTLPEGVPSDDFEPTEEDEKIVKKLHRRNSNQSLMLSSHSLQGSNCSLSSSGASCHNLATVRTSLSTFSLSDGRHKKLSLERRDSNASLAADHLTPTTRLACSSSASLAGEPKNCLLQRRGSNNSLTLNILSGNSLSRHSSNSSLNKDARPGQKKGLLERRSSNTSLTLNITTSNPQLAGDRGLSVSNYNLNGSTCTLSRYSSNRSIDRPAAETRKGILERRSSNASLTLNIRPQEPPASDVDETPSEDPPPRDRHRKSLSTENLIPKSYRNRSRLRCDRGGGFGSHDDLRSASFDEREYPPSSPYEGGAPEAEAGAGFLRSISTKPLSPQRTSEDFRRYLANMQQLHSASSVLTRRRLRELHEVFLNGYSSQRCSAAKQGQGCRCPAAHPQTLLPEPAGQPCCEYQKTLLRNLHQEFWDMPTNFQEKPIVSGSHAKNRYRTILPNEHSRVQLAAPARDQYINANYVKGHEYTKTCYIATQGPLPNTVHDFWLMVHQNCRAYPAPAEQKVVMLTNFVENNRQKCEKYFPLEVGEELVVPSQEDEAVVVVSTCGLETRPGYTVRRLRLQVDGQAVAVRHYWFHNWADHKCPQDVSELLGLSLDVLGGGGSAGGGSPGGGSAGRGSPGGGSPGGGSAGRGSPGGGSPGAQPPAVVHCSAGIGRTGCLVGILNGIRQLQAERRVDVLAIVSNMRLTRGGMVQNSEQYELIHKVLCLYEQACLPPL